VTRAEVVARARSVIGQGCIYKLGQGGFTPLLDHPWNSMKECDCSGFVAWCQGFSRMVTDPWYKSQNGGWFETTAIVRDALSEFGNFAAVPALDAKPGDVIVYGDKDGHQGHIGIISRIDENGVGAVVHCSSGNLKGPAHDAIQETDPHVFTKNGALIARFSMIEDV
jgi:cell wall-associated NlpC family hydrolase